MTKTLEEMEKRINFIKKNVDADNIWCDIKDLAREIYEEIKGYKIIKRIELNPKDTLCGSASFIISTYSEDMSVKLWKGESYYLGFFKNIDEVEHQISNTFNPNGALPIKSLDEFKERLYDFLANEIFNRDNKEILD